MLPLRDLYNERMLLDVGEALRELHPAFDPQGFAASAMEEPWEKASFKERTRLAALALGRFLPPSFPEAAALVCEAAERFRGLEYILFPDFVELFGLEHRETAMDALARLTRRSTSEFAVRAFLLADPAWAMERLGRWSRDPDEHVRRLATEGSRPRLPWGQRLPMFVRDPGPTLALLEPLLADESEYVRRSVANHLNDIAKDHPERVLELAERHLGRDAASDWTLRHASRTLLKQGHPQALRRFGFAPAAQVSAHGLQVLTPVVPFGGRLEFAFEIRNEGEPVQLRLEYEIGFVKASGRRAGKRFKLSERVYPHGSTPVVRSHAIKPITTRKYYPGLQSITLLINGEPQGELGFELTMEPAAAGGEGAEG
ncbi:DNA alkylation repair protein [Paenibacillus sp. FSL W8-1187]|uniref:DNA alkylation repair enzyme n=1 Tax=Paenibacillus pasadenensis TaxID=217090 RepID=A0A2N5NCX9_9BACL|nr:DNA alkylation repair protein [Paenibacillus pasadenensis]PLT48206.1 DNA alkylation repair enzyme [Paenibacillus pasadenensis]